MPENTEVWADRGSLIDDHVGNPSPHFTDAHTDDAV